MSKNILRGEKVNNDLENYAKITMNIPFVNFDGLDSFIIRDILITINKAYERYPLLKNSIAFIYQSEDFNKYENLIRCSNKEYWTKWCRFTKNTNNIISYYQEVYDKRLSTMTTINRYTKQIENMGLVIGSGFKYVNYIELQCMCIEDSISGFKTRHCRYFDSIVWHEIGHMLDDILHITQKEELKKMLFNVNISKEISKYATTSLYEVVAESFAEYIKALEANELEEGIVKKIGLLIDREYLRYAHNQGLRDHFNIKRNFPQARRR